jgi:hypothetical protein
MERLLTTSNQLLSSYTIELRLHFKKERKKALLQNAWYGPKMPLFLFAIILIEFFIPNVEQSLSGHF